MRYRIPILIVLASILIVACTDLATLRTSQPIAPVRDYETILVGNLEANYIGDDNCLAKCHIHDRIASDFKHSIHGDQISEETGLPLVNCESCHGPGSMAVENITQSSPATSKPCCRLPSSRPRPSRCSACAAIRRPRRQTCTAGIPACMP